jgi:hypothetical protein
MPFRLFPFYQLKDFRIIREYEPILFLGAILIVVYYSIALKPFR